VIACLATVIPDLAACGFALPRDAGLDWFSEARGLPMSETQQFETFMRAHQDMVFSTALRLLANPTEAEDIAQEVFLRAYERFDALRDSPTAAGWLKTVATNLSLNHLSRYRARWRFFSELFGKTAREEPEPVVEFPGPEDVVADLARSERQKLVEQALASLPAAQRVPLVLFHMEGLQYDEIAARLGVSLGKVKTDIFRGRDALRRKLRLQLDADERGTES